jgi:aminopeptidase N
MASRYYADADSNFMKADDVYSKGSIVLHMLRQRLGDEAFFAGVRDFIQRFKFREVETDDFRRVMEEVSGQSLERFFEQWVYRPGMPRLEIDLAWTPGTRTDDAGQALPEGSVTVTMEQVQTIDALNPAYALQLPIRFVMPDGANVWEYMTLDTRRGQATFTLPARPARVSVDPNITHLSINRIRTPLPEPEPSAAPEERPAESPAASPAPAQEPAPAIEPK